jgi:hypothetical protein
MLDVKGYGDAIVAAVKGYVRSAVETIAADVQQVADRVGSIEERFAAIEPGKDGRDGQDGAPGRDGVNGKDGADGKDGRDALELDILSAIDPAKSYPRGTVAAHLGGLIKAERRTSEITGALSDAGWRVICRGVADTQVIPGEDMRTLTVRVTHTDGEVIERRVTSPAMIYREIWREGGYEAGDAVTWGGSLWVALSATTEKPGDGAGWRLAVKKGRDGRDGAR